MNYTRNESHFLPRQNNLGSDTPASGAPRLWWRGEDSNLRRLSQQIYSLPPLTAREPLQLLSTRRQTTNPAPYTGKPASIRVSTPTNTYSQFSDGARRETRTHDLLIHTYYRFHGPGPLFNPSLGSGLSLHHTDGYA